MVQYPHTHTIYGTVSPCTHYIWYSILIHTLYMVQYPHTHTIYGTVSSYTHYIWYSILIHTLYMVQYPHTHYIWYSFLIHTLYMVQYPHTHTIYGTVPSDTHYIRYCSSHTQHHIGYTYTLCTGCTKENLTFPLWRKVIPRPLGSSKMYENNGDKNPKNWESFFLLLFCFVVFCERVDAWLQSVENWPSAGVALDIIEAEDQLELLKTSKCWPCDRLEYLATSPLLNEWSVISSGDWPLIWTRSWQHYYSGWSSSAFWSLDSCSSIHRHTPPTSS